MIITVAREEGSQGRDLARAVASALGLPYYDNEIISRAAQIARVSEEALEQARRAPPLLTRMIEALGRYPAGIEVPEAGTSLGGFTMTNEAYRHFIEEVIRSLADGPGGVILGHGAQAVLRGRGDAIHLRVCAPLEQRVRAVAATEGIAIDDARRRVRQADHDRADYLYRNYHIKWLDSSLYDLTLNTGRMPLGVTVEAVVSLARLRGNR